MSKKPMLKKGDKVVMHTCGEANFAKNAGNIWTCRTDETITGEGYYEQRLVFLDGYSGSFMTDYLQAVDVSPFEAELTKEREARWEYEKGVADAQLQVTDLARTLKWYADELNWNQGKWVEEIFITRANEDGGNRARIILSTLEGNEPNEG